MNRASSATGWVRNPVMKSPDLDPTQASSYDLGWAHNPITGCLNGCPYCYARKLANGRLKARYLRQRVIGNRRDGSEWPWPDDLYANPSQEYHKAFNDPFYPRFWPERLDEFHGGDYDNAYPDRNAYHASREKEKGVFVCDMGDLFGIGVPEAWTKLVMDKIKALSQHRFYLLTKQGQELLKWSPFPENCWVGVTATGYEAFNKALDYLKGIEAKVKYISIEPLLEAIPFYMERLAYCGINWLIIGSQTKPYRPPKIEWVKGIVEAADTAGIPLFLKDNLLESVNYGGKETDFAFNKDGYYRQEMPELKEDKDNG